MSDVLIAGAGPVGLVAAYELLRRGVDVRIVDAADGPATTSRAAAIHARTIETLDQMGLHPAFAERAIRGAGIAFHVDGRELASMDAVFTTQATRFDEVWFLNQAITEELLREAVTRSGGRIEWGVRVAALDQDGAGVRVRLEAADGRGETISVPYLVGCDGGHSTVRHALGISLQGDSSETWLIADAALDTAQPLPHDRIRWVRTSDDDGGRTTMIFPLVGDGGRRWRLLDSGDGDYDTVPDVVARRFADRLTAGLGFAVQVATPSWISVFTIQQRAIDRMHAGRVFLAGDAAHVHSPASGQGLNTGLQDAVNLAWKLAAVLHGADPALLATYSAERVPVGRALLGSTRMATMLVALRRPGLERHLPGVFGLFGDLPPLQNAVTQAFLGGMSALGVGYPTSPLTRHDADTTRPGPRPGERLAQVRASDAGTPGWLAVLAALREPAWTVVAGPDVAGADCTVASDDPAAAALGLGHDGWLLVRPDGYVTARGYGPADLDAARDRTFGAARLAVV